MKYYLILSNNERSYEYLKLLIQNKKKPISCIHLDISTLAGDCVTVTFLFIY